MDSLVSIIIPCYNAEKSIDRAIRSVYEQNYNNIELIVVDDGSTDHSRDRICSWKEKFDLAGKTLNYVYQENKGVGGAINTGLKLVTGKYLTLLDADDRYLQGSIYEKKRFLDNNPEYSMVRSNGWIVRGEQRWLFVQDEDEKTENYFEALTCHKTNNWAGSYMLRTELLFSFYSERSIYPSRFGQHFQLVLPVSYKNKCGFIDIPLVEYICQPESLSKTACKELQYEREEENAKGYRDIYYHVLNEIKCSNDEKEHYMFLYNVGFEKQKMRRAIQYGDKKQLAQSVKWLRERQQFTLDDRIQYYSINVPFYSFLLRALRKTRKILLCMGRARIRKAPS